MKKVLLFGSTGFIGSHLKPALIEAGYEVFDPRIEIRNREEVEEAMDQAEPDLVINATGITGKPNVDWCEDHPEETLSVNIGGSLNIASLAHERNLYMVQIGSGCIYDGEVEGGYTEEDEPNYTGSIYSRSRMLSEKALKEFPKVLQLRIRIPILGKPHPKNLIDKLKKYPSMINRLNSCTVIEDFIPATLKLIEKKETGIMNMTNVGAMDHQSIMSLYKEIVDPSFEINVMPETQQADLCLRRSNCVLSSEKREALGAHMPPLEESLKTILMKYKNEQAGTSGVSVANVELKVKSVEGNS